MARKHFKESLSAGRADQEVQIHSWCLCERTNVQRDVPPPTSARRWWLTSEGGCRFSWGQNSKKEFFTTNCAVDLQHPKISNHNQQVRSNSSQSRSDQIRSDLTSQQFRKQKSKKYKTKNNERPSREVWWRFLLNLTQKNKTVEKMISCDYWSTFNRGIYSTGKPDAWFNAVPWQSSTSQRF